MSIGMRSGDIVISLCSVEQCDDLLKNPQELFDLIGKRRDILKDAFKKDAKFVKWWNEKILPTLKDSYEGDYCDPNALYRWNFVSEFIQELIYEGGIIEENKLIQMVSVRMYSDRQHEVIISALKLVGLYKDK
jgi:hypothetical protein